MVKTKFASVEQRTNELISLHPSRPTQWSGIFGIILSFPDSIAVLARVLAEDESRVHCVFWRGGLRVLII